MTQYGKRTARKSASEQVMTLRMLQLMVCLIIFTTVYATKGVFPYKIQRLSENVTTLVTTSVDVGEAVSSLGEALAEGESVIGELGNFCVEVFGGQVAETAVEVDYPILDVVVEEPEVIAPTLTEMEEIETVEPLLEEVVETVEEEMEIMAVGLVYISADEDLRALPAGYTYDMLSLGGMERTTPVMGVISSGFGYRIHPLSGDDTIHNGVDIAGDVGDPIYAFSSGTVEYIGYSDTYGNYFRIDHGNGVKSFYAHCNTLLVSKGDAVEVGQLVAEVGQTGDVTGPHLHFELLCNDIRIDPALYIDSL